MCRVPKILYHKCSQHLVKLIDNKIRLMSVKNKYVKYERKYNMSMWHTDWYEIADPRWRRKYLLVYLDDPSRFIAGHGAYDNATADNAMKLLDDCIAKYGKPSQGNF